MNQTKVFGRVRMIRIALLAATIVASGASIGMANEPKGNDWSNNLENAIKDSKKSGRPIMLVFTGSDWCLWCQKLDRDIFAKPEFSQWSKKLIKMEIDFPQSTSLPKRITDRNEWLLERYEKHVESYPTILFINAKGKVLAKTGYINNDVNNWIANADKILPKTRTASATVDVQVAGKGK